MENTSRTCSVLRLWERRAVFLRSEAGGCLAKMGRSEFGCFPCGNVLQEGETVCGDFRRDSDRLRVVETDWPS